MQALKTFSRGQKTKKKIVFVLVSICKSKWTSLRNSFARELRELKNKQSGSASSKKRKWYLFESMSFLTDFMLQHKKMASNISDIYVEETEENRESDEEQNVTQVEENTTVEKSIITESEPDFRQPVFKKPKKKEYKTASEKVAEPMIEFLKSRTNKPTRVEDPPELLFFKSLIPDYNKLNEKNQRRFKNDLLTILNNYLDEQEHYTQGVSLQNNINPYPYTARQICEQNVNAFYQDFASEVSSPSPGNSNNSF